MDLQKVAYRIETPRLVIRAWDPKDYALLKDAIDRSIDHLLPFLPWARYEPEPIDDKIARIRRWRADYDSDKEYVMGVFSPDETKALGGTGLHARVGDHALEIGYWIAAEAVRQGFATELSAALTKVGFEVMGMRRMEIHCDERNIGSAKVPEKLGYSLDAKFKDEDPGEPGAYRMTMVWRMFYEDYLKSPAKDIHIKAYDIVNRLILED